MKGRVIALGRLAGRNAAALMVDGQLEDLLIDPPQDHHLAPGAICRAVCQRPLKGQGGMIVGLPDGTGFLRASKGLRPGQTVLVQVSGYAESGKAVPVSARVLFKSKYAIVTPDAPGINVSRAIKDEEARVRLLEIAHDLMDPSGTTGLIVRSEAEHGEDDAIADDMRAMTDLAAAVTSDTNGQGPELLVDAPDAHEIAWREWGQSDIFDQSATAFEDQGVLDLLDQTLAPRVTLAGGGHAFVEPTRALVAVDVNTGGDTSPAAGLKANIAIARDLPRLLRCRGLGGQITIDFAPLAKKDRRQLEQVLKSAFRADQVDTTLAGWTPLGHFELHRKRERFPVGDLEVK